MVSAAALGGRTEDGEQFSILTLEAPPTISLGGRRLSKPEIERLHLEKYRLDVLVTTGVLPFDSVIRGERPDFVVTTPDGDEGLDCTALTLEKRRNAYALFERFRSGILAAALEKAFPSLRDCLVSVWFGKGGDLPPKAHDQSTVDRLVKVLRESRIDRAAVAALSDRIAREGFPESLAGEPGVPIVSAGDAGGASITPVEPNSLQGDFPEQTGFEVTLAMSIRVTKSDVQTELSRVVEAHDTAGVDRLLVNVGGPDRSGLLYPGEDLVVGQLQPEPLVTSNVKSVVLHSFVTGEMRELCASADGH
jgi:hypothetical protein